MFSTDFIFRQQDNLVDNQKYQAGFRQLCKKILLLHSFWFGWLGKQMNHLLLKERAGVYYTIAMFMVTIYEWGMPIVNQGY